MHIVSLFRIHTLFQSTICNCTLQHTLPIVQRKTRNYIKMETLKVELNGKTYMLSNLTTQLARQLRGDRQRLLKHVEFCLIAGSNICLLGNEGNTSSTTMDRMHDSNTTSGMTFTNSSCTSASVNTPCTSSSVYAASTASRGKQTFYFLCENFEGQNYIYGVKFDNHGWQYFEEHDCISSKHCSLPTSVHTKIGQMTSVGTIKVSLDEAQARQYFYDDKFMFENKELKPYLAMLGNINENETASDKTTKRLIFISGQTNPLLFLNDFEKCKDCKSDNDKMYQILHFVDDCHKGEFTELCFNSNWNSVKSRFLNLYTLSFIQNKKRFLNVDFSETNTLRTFFELKLEGFSKFTTLPFINQVEIILNDLPPEISKRFIINEKMTGNKTEILNFCDAIQDLTEHFNEKNPSNETHQESTQPSNRMEMDTFNFTPVKGETMSSRGRVRKRGRGRGRGRGRAGGGGNDVTELNTVIEENESSDSYTFLEQMENTSR